MFGYKNHVGIDREHGFVRRFTVTHAAAHDGAQLSAVLDPGNTASAVWAPRPPSPTAFTESLRATSENLRLQGPAPGVRHPQV